MIHQLNARILKNTMIADNYFIMVIEAPQISKNSLPGQFVNIKIPEENVPFLRKPFTIYDADKNDITIIYKIIGKGTSALSDLKNDQKISIMGPLGKIIEIPSKNQKIALVAGGVGIASLKLLAQKIPQKFDLFYGVKTKKEVLEIKAWEKLANKIVLSSDDGSCGQKNFIPAVFGQKIKQYTLVYTCGPEIMMKQISLDCKKNKLQHYVIMESYMACGYGVCMGCMVKTMTGYKRACKEGPVFDGDEIEW